MHTITYEFDELNLIDEETGGFINSQLYGIAHVSFDDFSGWHLRYIELSCHNGETGDKSRSWTKEIHENHYLYQPIKLALIKCHDLSICLAIKKDIENCEYFRHAAE